MVEEEEDTEGVEEVAGLLAELPTGGETTGIIRIILYFFKRWEMF